MNRMRFLPILIFCLTLSASCEFASGGSEAGNPAREVTGSVESPEDSAALNFTSFPTCSADRVVATDSSGNSVSTRVDQNCLFIFVLTTGRAYSFQFLQNNQRVASFLFNNRASGFASPTFFLSRGDTTVRLGQFQISGGFAFPELEPSRQCDQDEDGIDDFEDEDDDNDGILDEDELDDDLDGTLDDYDDQNDDPSNVSGSEARILEVFPRNTASFFVPLDQDVKARIACEIDVSTVTSSTFHVQALSGEVIDCGEFQFSQSGQTIECRHEDDAFLPNTLYTATLSGVQCLDGNTVETRSWTWMTEFE